MKSKELRRLLAVSKKPGVMMLIDDILDDVANEDEDINFNDLNLSVRKFYITHGQRLLMLSMMFPGNIPEESLQYLQQIEA